MVEQGAGGAAGGSEAGKQVVGARYAGDVLGGTYRILRRIGAGGMADVFEVEHLRLGSRFAAKVSRASSDDDMALRRFVREARMLASLKSEHIVRVMDVSGPGEEVPFFVMELLEGQDLRRLLRSTPVLSVGRAVKLVSDACLGLAVVHAAGVIHRDLKPENLFVTHRDSGEELCKLLDFGVVKAAEGTSTQHGALIGTVRYMAPEQIEHAGTVCPQSDVRALAAILYECLVGRPPFEADGVERLLYKILKESPAPLQSLRDGIPVELDAIVLRALERDPSRRHASAREFAQALRPFADETIVPAALTAGNSTAALAAALDLGPRPVGRSVAIAVGASLLVAGAAWALLSARTGPREEPPKSPVRPAATARALEPAPSTPAPPAASAVPLRSEAPRAEPLRPDPPEDKARPERRAPRSAPSVARRTSDAPPAASAPARAPALGIDLNNPYGP